MVTQLHDILQREVVQQKELASKVVTMCTSDESMADHIIVLEKAEILEEGSHEELLASDGQYATLFNLQAQGYQ